MCQSLCIFGYSGKVIWCYNENRPPKITFIESIKQAKQDQCTWVDKIQLSKSIFLSGRFWWCKQSSFGPSTCDETNSGSLHQICRLHAMDTRNYECKWRLITFIFLMFRNCNLNKHKNNKCFYYSLIWIAEYYFEMIPDSKRITELKRELLP